MEHDQAQEGGDRRQAGASCSPSSSRRSPSPPASAAATRRGTRACATAVAEARSSSVPKDNIERAIKKGHRRARGRVYEEVIYEGYGPGGVAVLVEALTDNRNRTAGEIRHIFARNGGNLGEAGCVAWMFNRRGYFAVEPAAPWTRRSSWSSPSSWAPTTSPSRRTSTRSTPPLEDFNRVQEELERRGVPTAAKELAMVPQTTIDVPPDKVNQVLRLMEALEDHDDVQKVWANLNVDEKVLDRAVPLTVLSGPCSSWGSIRAASTPATGWWRSGAPPSPRSTPAASPARATSTSPGGWPTSPACLGELVDRRRPDLAVLETPFHGMNSRSLIVLAQARGALLAVARRARPRDLRVQPGGGQVARSPATAAPTRSRSPAWCACCSPRAARAGRATPPTPWPSPSAAPSGCSSTAWRARRSWFRYHERPCYSAC